MSLDGVWFRCAIQKKGLRAPLWLIDPDGKFVGGLSGSPIVSAHGGAIGVACVGAESASGMMPDWPQGPNPSLLRNLPGWLLQEVQQG